MIYFDRKDVFEGIYINKTNAWKEYNICHYWYILNNGFKIQRYVCYRCHDVLTMSMNLNHIAILKIKNADCCCIFSRISKSEAIKLVQNID